MRAAVADQKKRPVAGTEVITECVELYLVKKSGRAKSADCAPYDMRWLLRDGSKRQPSLLQWAAENEFTKLSEITSEDVDRWRNTWVFREASYSLKNSNARIKAFFTWAVKFEHLDKNPFEKLDTPKLTPVPTLPLSPEDFQNLLRAAENLKLRQGSLHFTLVNLILLMRWSGLAILDATSLKRDALKADNTLRTYRQKINKAQAGPDGYVKIPAELAERLRAQRNSHPDYFFWHGRGTAKNFAHTIGQVLRKIYDHAGITPRGAHRLRDTFACEYLNVNRLMQDLAKFLGHSTMATTEAHYSPWDKSRQKHLNQMMDQNLAVQAPTFGLRLEAATVKTAVQ
jgi:integrase